MPVPGTMRAITIPNPHRTEGALVAAEIPVPHPREDEVLIRVSHAGVNRADILQRKGLYPAPEGASPLPGLEVSGAIAALGSEVQGWRVGDAVCALLPGGGYAEYATAHHRHLLPIPAGWDMAQAAALPEAVTTVWMALAEEARLAAGESVLIHAGASGIGMTAIQYAQALGATVYTTAGTPGKCDACRRWGADMAIHYRSEDFVSAVSHATQGRGVDVVLDVVGGGYIQRNFSVLAADGRMVSLAFLDGARIDSLNIAPMVAKRLLWKGATLRARSDSRKAAYIDGIRTELWPMLTAGIIRPEIYRVFSLAEAEKAHVTMEQNLNIGKIVLQV